MVPSSQSSASSANDRYRANPVPAQNNQRGHNLTKTLEEVSHFDLLLNLPIFDSNIPRPDDYDSRSITESEKVKDPADLSDEKDDLEPVDSYVPIVAAPYFEEIQPVAKSEPIHDEKSSLERRKTKGDFASNRRSTNESERDAVAPASFTKPVETKTSAPESIVESADTQKNLGETPVADQAFDEHTDVNDSHINPLATTVSNDETQVVENARSQQDNKHLQSDRSSLEAQFAVENHREPSKESPPEQLSAQEPRDPIEHNHSDHESFQPNRRAERLENDRRNDEDSSNNSEAESNAPVASLDSNEIAVAFDSSVTETEPVFEPSDVQLAGAIALQATTTSAIASDTIQTSSAAIAATANLSNARDLAVTTTASPSNTTSGAVNASSSINGGQTNTSSTAGPSGSASSGRSTLTPYQEQKVLQRVLRGMEQLANGSNQVRLRLHPPELGSLQVTIRIEGQQVAGLIEVEHAAARDALQNNLPQLQARLSDQGLNVQQFEIRVVDLNQFSQGDQLGGNWQNGSQQSREQREERRANSYLDRLRNRIDSKESEPARPNLRLWTRTHGQIDVRV
jgi:flagellar hook-length control protein FliK